MNNATELSTKPLKIKSAINFKYWENDTETPIFISVGSNSSPFNKNCYYSSAELCEYMRINDYENWLDFEDKQTNKKLRPIVTLSYPDLRVLESKRFLNVNQSKVYFLKHGDLERELIENLLDYCVAHNVKFAEILEYSENETGECIVECVENLTLLIELSEKPTSLPASHEQHKKNYKSLGFDSGYYFLISMTQLQVLKLKATELNQNNLLQLAPIDYWLYKYCIYSNTGPDRVNWPDAVNDIIQDCTSAGIYNPDSIRGRGFWKDNDIVVRHLGDRLLDVTNNKSVNMLNKNLEGVYQRSGAVNFPTIKSANKEQVDKFTDAVKTIYWQHKSHSDLYLGWAALAPFCGLLKWRPHIWISGEHGSGKSDTALEGLSIALGKNQHIHAKDSTTEAGLRQTVKSDSIPFILDEMEPNDKKDRLRIDRILSLARNSSSDDEALTLKGTVTGDSTSYRVRSMFCSASINTHLPELADQSRWSILDIEKRPQTDQSKKDFEFIKRTWLELDRENFGYALSNLMIERINTLNINLKIFIEAAGDVLGSARDGKQYGTLLAGLSTMKDANPVTMDLALEMIKDIEMKSSIIETRDTEATGWNECWANISVVKLDLRTLGAKISVSEALEMIHTNDTQQLSEIFGLNNEGFKTNDWQEVAARKAEKELKTALRNIGIIYQVGTESLYGNSGAGIYLANKSENLKKALKGSAFESWTQYSRRVGDTCPKMIKASGNVTRARFIPISEINS